MQLISQTALPEINLFIYCLRERALTIEDHSSNKIYNIYANSLYKIKSNELGIL